MLTSTVNAVQWIENGHNFGICRLLDQKLLPGSETYIDCMKYQDVVLAIKDLKVRGAPAIGIAGAYGVVLAAQEASSLYGDDKKTYYNSGLDALSSARPTAINLKWAVARMSKVSHQENWSDFTVNLIKEAKRIHEEDIKSNQLIASIGASVIKGSISALTYCNTGNLATGGIGTALGVLKEAYKERKVSHIFSCETRPVLQGLRLTAWELERSKIPFTVICDNMAGALMKGGKVGAVFLGADRIAANGDVANKVGTYSLSVLCHFHKIPFYVIAPSSSFDLSIKSGLEIPIEQRPAEEILKILSSNINEARHWPFETYNPSFDVTPNELITAIICEKGIIFRPTVERVLACLEK